MNLYFAVTGKREPIYIAASGYRHILMSYHYYKKDIGSVVRALNYGCSVFIDSGAFSAKMIGAEINIEEYYTFLSRVNPSISVSLDVINDAEKTKKNWLIAKDVFKINAMPTFHTGEPIEYLMEYIAKCDYIALGGLVQKENLESWLDKVWSVILKSKPELKVHGFAITNQYLVMKYPWHSFDSSSFKSGKRFGRVPVWNGRKMDNINVALWRHELHKKKPHYNLMEDDILYQELCDLQGCRAYAEMVEFYAGKERNFNFQNQLELF